MLKLVYPFASKTFKVLSYCDIRMYKRNLVSNVTQCILHITMFTLIISERQEVH